MIGWKQAFSKEEIQFAFTKRQLVNHSIHISVGTAIFLSWYYFIHGSSRESMLVVILTGALKEYVETMLKHVFGRTFHFIDSVMDFSGWVFSGVLLRLIF